MFLQGNTLALRALEPEDLDILYRWENDSELWIYGSSIAPYSRFALRDYFENSLRGIAETHQLRLMLVRKDTAERVGTVDLYDIDLINGRAGVGVLVDKDFRNQGIGEEMLDLIRDYAFRILVLRQLYAHIPKANIPSVKLFTKCGYIQGGMMKDWIKTADGYEDVYFMQLING